MWLRTRIPRWTLQVYEQNRIGYLWDIQKLHWTTNIVVWDLEALPDILFLLELFLGWLPCLQLLRTAMRGFQHLAAKRCPKPLTSVMVSWSTSLQLWRGNENTLRHSIWGPMRPDFEVCTAVRYYRGQSHRPTRRLSPTKPSWYLNLMSGSDPPPLLEVLTIQLEKFHGGRRLLPDTPLHGFHAKMTKMVGQDWYMTVVPSPTRYWDAARSSRDAIVMSHRNVLHWTSRKLRIWHTFVTIDYDYQS